jgi:hypothetical protein
MKLGSDRNIFYMARNKIWPHNFYELVFRDVIPCILIVEATCLLKHASTALHGTTFQKTVIFIFITKRTTNLTQISTFTLIIELVKGQEK